MSKTQFPYLTTHGWKTGKQHRIEIWFVEHNERYDINLSNGRARNEFIIILSMLHKIHLALMIMYSKVLHE